MSNETKRPETADESLALMQGMVTEGFDDEVGYLEGVTVTDQAEAVRLFCEDRSVTADEIEVKPIHMRWVTEDPDPVAVPDLPCWLECEADHPDAKPFWSVRP
jgi:hypothetical protein